MKRSFASGLMALASAATVLLIVLADAITDWLLDPPPLTGILFSAIALLSLVTSMGALATAVAVVAGAR